jgi:nicotinamidase-related amidase
MAKVLVVVDMQNDFLTGALKNDEGVKVIPYIKEKLAHVHHEDTIVCFTRDTHFGDYLDTEEGRNLPVSHCIYGTEGWQITEELNPVKDGALPLGTYIFDKVTFGSQQLASFLSENAGRIEEVELVGVCTDICVISNALLAKAALPNVPIYVDAAGCAGVTPESHETALKAMEMCHVHVRK